MTFQERYQYNPQTDLLGKGGFARVYKAHDVLLKREVAIKVFPSGDKEKYSVIEEISKAIGLQHPSLLRYYDVALVATTNSFGEKENLQIGVMELANYGDLKGFIKNNPNSPFINTLLIQVLEGLSYLHSKGIIHRDLKPQNILLVKDESGLQAKISDFGISKDMGSSGESSSAVLGTIEYMAPEQFNPVKYGIGAKISTNLDLWSFGIMVYELFTGASLFGRRSANITSEHIMNAILSTSDGVPADVSKLAEPYQSIVRKCLVANANVRVKEAKELITILLNGNNTNGGETEEIHISPIDYMEETQEIRIKPITTEPIINSGTEKTGKNTAPKNKIILLVGAVVLVIGLIYFWKFANNESPEEAYTYYVNNPSADSVVLAEKLHFALEQNYLPAVIEYSSQLIAKKDFANALSYLDKADATDIKVLKLKAKIWQQTDPSNQKTQIVKNFEKCAESGDAECAFDLGTIKYDSNDKKNAFKWFMQSAQADNAEAQAMLGTMYYNAEGGVTKDDNEALNWYMKAAEKGNGVALFSLGIFYEEGIAVAKNRNEAIKYFKKAIKSENTSAKEAAKAELQILESSAIEQF